MNRKVLMMQMFVCLLVFVTVESGIYTKAGKLGDFLDMISEAVQENYTLAELLELKETAKSAMTQAPVAVSQMVLAAGELGNYGIPMDEESGDVIKNVYASAGGKVIRSGVSTGLGYYVIIEHPGKISTYGHLSQIQAVSGERVTKGDILGSYDSSLGEDFYYALEDKSGNLS